MHPLSNIRPSKEHMNYKLASVILVGVAASYATAQTNPDISSPPTHSYNQNSSGVITRSEFGLCWRSGSWSENDAIAGCDGALVSPIPNPTAPEVASRMPEPSPTLTAAPCEFTLSGDQNFAFNDEKLNSAAKHQIESDVLPLLAACKNIEKINITGHTDNLGSIRSNRTLSEKRARSVAKYLKIKGVTTKMNVIGAGASGALKSCSNTLNRSDLIRCSAPNRRVSIEVITSAK